MEEKRNQKKTPGEVLAPKNFVRKRKKCQDDWDVISSMIRAIQDQLRKVEEVAITNATDKQAKAALTILSQNQIQKLQMR